MLFDIPLAWLRAKRTLKNEGAVPESKPVQPAGSALRP
jgi:hypothetical protein